MAASGECIALVPERGFRTGKSRLSPVLTPEERDELGRWMLGRVLVALRESDSVGRVAILSEDDEVLAFAGENGAAGIRCESAEMNADLEKGRAWSLSKGAGALLVIPGDLPALRAIEVDSLIELGEKTNGEKGCVVLTPALDGGTNGIYLRPASALPFSFGPGSFKRHSAVAKAAGLEVSRFESLGLCLDVDRPSDIVTFLRSGVPAPEWLTTIPLP